MQAGHIGKPSHRGGAWARALAARNLHAQASEGERKEHRRDLGTGLVCAADIERSAGGKREGGPRASTVGGRERAAMPREEER